MVINHEVQCDSKQILIDSFQILEDDKNPMTEIGSVKVYLLPDKKSVKRYCKDTGLEFREGLRRYFTGGLRLT